MAVYESSLVGDEDPAENISSGKVLKIDFTRADAIALRERPRPLADMLTIFVPATCIQPSTSILMNHSSSYQLVPID